MNKIAQGITPDIVTGINLTPPGARSQDVVRMNDELTIIGIPVYAGRVPPEAVRRLRRIKGNPSGIRVCYAELICNHFKLLGA